MTITELLEKKGRLANEAQQILDAAATDKREVLREEEEKKFNDLHKDIEQLTKTVGLMKRQADTMAELEASDGRRSEAAAPSNGETRGSTSYESRLVQGRRDHEDALRAWGLKATDVAPNERQLAAAKRVGLDVTSKILTMHLPERPLRSLRREDRRQWEDELRALGGPQSSTAGGGYTIQDAMMRELEVAMLSFGGMREVATVLRTDTGGPLPIPTCDDTSNVGAILVENTTAAAQDVAFGQLVLDAYKYSSKYVLVSVELLQDNSINLPQFLGSALGTRIGRITNTHFTTGTGTGRPNGIVVAATATQVATGSTTTITLAQLITAYHAVDPSYRRNAKWMWADSTLAKLKQINDSQGRPIWLPGLVDGAPDTFMGSPYVINQDMAAMTATSKPIIFGDLSKYLIRDVRDVTLLRLDERFAEYHQVAFLAFSRTDGDLLDAGTHPVRAIQMAAT